MKITLDDGLYERLLADAKEHAALIKRYAHETGPCDHIGVCACGLPEEAERNRVLLRDLGELV